jgi:hypothetical protein
LGSVHTRLLRTDPLFSKKANSDPNYKNLATPSATGLV